MLRSLARHWPEYLIEACGLGFFMLSAGLFGALLEHPASPARELVPDALARRALMGLAMGLTAVSIIYSPWGMRSGAHINPSVTLTFLRLGKIQPADAGLYILAQFIGGTAGIALAGVPLRRALADPAVRYVVTVPGDGGPAVAFAAETVISFVLMTAILIATNTRRLARTAGVIAGALVAIYITVEAPLSGMSMNPARTFASAARAGVWNGFWIYLIAPPLAMLAAAELYVRLLGARRVHCAKLHHENSQPCIFRCNYPMPAEGGSRA